LLLLGADEYSSIVEAIASEKKLKNFIGIIGYCRDFDFTHALDLRRAGS
jgi:hypothetical protein